MSILSSRLNSDGEENWGPRNRWKNGSTLFGKTKKNGASWSWHARLNVACMCHHNFVEDQTRTSDRLAFHLALRTCTLSTFVKENGPVYRFIRLHFPSPDRIHKGRMNCPYPAPKCVTLLLSLYHCMYLIYSLLSSFIPCRWPTNY
jgi:hypothetical protein